jgi:glutamyl-tRNA reductase
LGRAGTDITRDELTDYQYLEFDLLRAKRVVVIGNEATDAAEHAIEVLSRAAIEEVVIVGRRGPPADRRTHRHARARPSRAAPDS